MSSGAIVPGIVGATLSDARDSRLGWGNLPRLTWFTDIPARARLAVRWMMYARASRGRDHRTSARPLARGGEDRVRAGARDQRAEDVRPAALRTRGAEDRRRRPAGQAVRGEGRRG